MNTFRVAPIVYLTSALVAGALGVSLTARADWVVVQVAPFKLPSMKAKGGKAWFGRLGRVDGKSIQLRGYEDIDKDGVDRTEVSKLRITDKTIYCHGKKRVTEWAYLNRLIRRSDIVVTVMTNEEDYDALIIWDQGPDVHASVGGALNGRGDIQSKFPAMCE